MHNMYQVNEHHAFPFVVPLSGVVMTKSDLVYYTQYISPALHIQAIWHSSCTHAYTYEEIFPCSSLYTP